MHLKVVHGLPHLSEIKKTLPQLNAHSQWHAHHPTLFAIFHLKDKGTRHLECFGLLLIMGPSLQSPLWVVLPRRSFPQAANSGVNATWPKSAAVHNQPEANWSIAEATNLRIWRKKWDLNSHAYYSQRFSRPRPLALLGLFFLIVVGVVGVEPTRFHRGVTVPSLTIREHTHGSLTWVRTRDQQINSLLLYLLSYQGVISHSSGVGRS